MLLLRIVVLLFATSWVAHATDDQCDFKCGDGKCISAFWQCDNIKDCSDGSDEANCNYLHQCSHNMFMCRNGECIKANKKCNDIVDCLDGTDERGCFPRSSCPQQNASLFFTNYDSSIYRYRIDGSAQTPEYIFNNKKGPITSMTCKDDTSELLFVTMHNNTQIRSIAKNGKLKILVNHEFEYFEHITANPLTNNVYFMKNGIGIGACDKNVDKCVILINATSSPNNYSNLILHPRRGSMFWIEHQPKPVIKVAGMDGKNPRRLGKFEHVYAITMDHENELLFVANENEISTLDLHTLTQTQFSNVRATTILFFNCNMYYVQRETSFLRVLNDHNEDKEIIPLTGSSFIFELVPDTHKVLPFEDPCLELNCPKVCVLMESSIVPEAKCLDQIYLNVGPKNSTINGDVPMNSKTVQSNDTTLQGIIAIFIILVLLIFISISLVIYFRLWPTCCGRLNKIFGLNNSRNKSNLSVKFNKNLDLE